MWYFCSVRIRLSLPCKLKLLKHRTETVTWVFLSLVTLLFYYADPCGWVLVNHPLVNSSPLKRCLQLPGTLTGAGGKVKKKIRRSPCSNGSSRHWVRRWMGSEMIRAGWRERLRQSRGTFTTILAPTEEDRTVVRTLGAAIKSNKNQWGWGRGLVIDTSLVCMHEGWIHPYHWGWSMERARLFFRDGICKSIV